jgi:predicted NBD/HSP70 family sugar kinase
MRLGIDLGGTKTEVIGLDTDGAEIYRKGVDTDSSSYEAIVATTSELVTEAESALARNGDGAAGDALNKTGGHTKINSIMLVPALLSAKLP